VFRIAYSEQFEQWQNLLANRLIILEAETFDSIWPQHNYSIESLDVLEEWILDKYQEWKPPLEKRDAVFIDITGTYVGETFRKHLSGNWTIELEDKENAYWGIPGITGFNSSRPIRVVYPHTWVTTSIHRRTGVFIRRRLESYLTS
jgi:hypothetical protein